MGWLAVERHKVRQHPRLACVPLLPSFRTITFQTDCPCSSLSSFVMLPQSKGRPSYYLGLTSFRVPSFGDRGRGYASLRPPISRSVDAGFP